MIDGVSPLSPAAERMRRYRGAASATQAKAQGQAHCQHGVSKHNPTEGVVKMSETVPCVMMHVGTGERTAIQLKPAGGRSAAEAQAILEGRRKEAERITPRPARSYGGTPTLSISTVFSKCTRSSNVMARSVLFATCQTAMTGSGRGIS